MIRRTAALVAGLMLASTGAPALGADLEFYTGTALFAQCGAGPADTDYAVREARCAGYVLGVSDAQQALQGGGGTLKVCIPSTAGSAQLIDAVTRFLQSHADKRPLAAQDLVIEALSAQFPCK